MKIPAQGRPQSEVLQQLSSFRDADITWEDGRSFSHIFLATQEARRVAEQAYVSYLWENGLDPTLFPSLARLERDIVQMARHHLRGDEKVVGSFTSGGTESVMLAVKTARDRARASRPELQRPHMVLPITAHPCFHKAAHYFHMETTITGVDPQSFKADVEAMEAAIRPETALLVASAPSYAHGVIDPIPQLGALAQERELLLHVDGCIGAFLLPYFRKLGAPQTDFDFTVPGVSSISMDFHKYAYAAKGASVVLYRDAELRRHQFFAWSGWPGYTLVNATIQSSKSGGPLAATWAVMQHLGEDGYLEIARGLKAGTEKIIAMVDGLDEVFLLGQPEMCLLALASDTLDLFRLCDAMKKRGWSMYPQLKVGTLRESLHLTLLPWNLPQLDQWGADMAESVAEIKAQAPSQQWAELREMLVAMDLSMLTDEGIENILDTMGVGASDVPAEMAEINGILNALPPEITNRILTLYFDRLSR